MRSTKIIWFLAALSIMLLGIGVGEYVYLGSTPSHTPSSPSIRAVSPIGTVASQPTAPEQTSPHSTPTARVAATTSTQVAPPPDSTLPAHTTTPLKGAVSARGTVAGRGATRASVTTRTQGTAGTRGRTGAHAANAAHAAVPARSATAGRNTRPTKAAAVPRRATPKGPEPDLVYVVRPLDTLWALAAAHLGNPYRWVELFDLNRGRAEPGGSLVDANLIYRGWTLQFPVGATGLLPRWAPARRGTWRTSCIRAIPSGLSPPLTWAAPTAGSSCST